MNHSRSDPSNGARADPAIDPGCMAVISLQVFILLLNFALILASVPAHYSKFAKHVEAIKHILVGIIGRILQVSVSSQSNELTLKN